MKILLKKMKKIVKKPDKNSELWLKSPSGYVTMKHRCNEVQIIKIILSVIFIIDCIALTVVVLMQEGKQQGLGAIAGAAETYWGKNKGRSMEGGLVKATTIMGILFFVISVALNMLG